MMPRLTASRRGLAAVCMARTVSHNSSDTIRKLGTWCTIHSPASTCETARIFELAALRVHLLRPQMTWPLYIGLLRMPTPLVWSPAMALGRHPVLVLRRGPVSLRAHDEPGEGT